MAKTYATWNPLAKSGLLSLSNEDLTVTHTGANNWGSILGNIGKSSGKWYWELTTNNRRDAYDFLIGVAILTLTLDSSSFLGLDTKGWGLMGVGNKYHNGDLGSYGSNFNNGDIIGIALDMDSGTMIMYKNGTLIGQVFSGISGTVFPALSMYGQNGTILANFGKTTFAYSVPSGYNAGFYDEILGSSKFFQLF